MTTIAGLRPPSGPRSAAPGRRRPLNGANIRALFDAFGPDAEDRITVATCGAGMKNYYVPDMAGVPGDQLVDARAV